MRNQSFVVLRPFVPKREPKLQAPPSRDGGRALRAPTWLSLIGSSHSAPRATMIAYVLARSRCVTRLVRAKRTTVHSVHHRDIRAGTMRRPGGSSPRPARAARTSVHSERRPERVRTIALLHPPAMPQKMFAPPGRTSRKRTVRTREYAYGRLPGCKKRRGRYRIPLCTHERDVSFAADSILEGALYLSFYHLRTGVHAEGAGRYRRDAVGDAHIAASS